MKKFAAIIALALTLAGTSACLTQPLKSEPVAQIQEVKSPAIIADANATLDIPRSEITSTPAPVQAPIIIEAAPIVVPQTITTVTTIVPETTEILEPTIAPQLTCEDQGLITAEDLSCVAIQYYDTCEEYGLVTAEDGSCVNATFYTESATTCSVDSYLFSDGTCFDPTTQETTTTPEVPATNTDCILAEDGSCVNPDFYKS